MTDEQFVREHWENVSYCSREETNSCCPPSVFIAPFLEGKWEADFCRKTKSEAWSDAAEFTRERLEQIRKVWVDVATLRGMVKQAHRILLLSISYEPYQSFLVGQTVDLVRWSRILAREQSILAELKRGMKQQ
jgi:hypothetical protein